MAGGLNQPDSKQAGAIQVFNGTRSITVVLWRLKRYMEALAVLASVEAA